MIPLRDDNPTHIVPVVTYVILGLCGLVFLWQISLDPAGARTAVYALGVIPATLLQGAQLPPGVALVPPTVTILTSMFLHGGLMHFIGNMLYLWIFADNVEDSMGSLRFVGFYLLCGVAAVLAQALPAPDSQVPMIGASGAISGVLGAYLLLYPYNRIKVLVIFFFITVVQLPAMVMLGIWFALQVFNALGSLGLSSVVNVAYTAHVGGFVAGALFMVIYKMVNRQPVWPPRNSALSNIRYWRGRPLD